MLYSCTHMATVGVSQRVNNRYDRQSSDDEIPHNTDRLNSVRVSRVRSAIATSRLSVCL